MQVSGRSAFDQNHSICALDSYRQHKTYHTMLITQQQSHVCPVVTDCPEMSVSLVSIMT